MKTTSQKLAEWAINKIKTEYPNDIALLIAVENQSVNNDGHSECFDYFVPASERGCELGRTFIIDGVGHDLYPRSWELNERTADFDDGFSLGLGKAKILYSRTKEDEQRFLTLRQKMFKNLKNKDFMRKKALVQLDQAMDLYRTMMFENELYKVRMATGYISDFLSTAIAYLNETYIDKWCLGNLAQLLKLQNLPDGFTQYLKVMFDTESVDELKNISHLMISSVRRFIEKNTPIKQSNTSTSDINRLAEWYQELALVWHRIAYYCDIENAELALQDACYLQSELMIVQEEFGLAEMNLLGDYHSSNLSQLKLRSNEIENYVTNTIEKGGAKIEKYQTVDDFLKSN